MSWARCELGNEQFVGVPIDRLASKVRGGISRDLADVAPAVPPLPIDDLRHVLAVLVDVLGVLDQFVAHRLLGVGGSGAELGHPVDYVPTK